MDLAGGSDDNSEAIDFILPSSFTSDEAEGTLTFSPRTSTATAAPTSIDITDSDIDFNAADGTYELTESFALTLSSVDANAAEAPGASRSTTHTYSITNKDALPQISFTTDAFTIYERDEQGANSATLEFAINTNSTEKSEVPVRAYFKIAANSDAGYADADITDDGTLDYAYNSGALTDNQVVVIDGSATELATTADVGSLVITANDDTADEPEEKFKVQLITYDASSPEASISPVSDSGISNATAPDGPNVGVDTGYDEVTITIAEDPGDKPQVYFYNSATLEAASAVSVAESAGTVTVTLMLDQVSGKDITVPYTVTLDYDNDVKTARLGTSTDADYPYDYRGWAGLTITGDGVSTNNVTATGSITIVAGQQSNSFTITINDDDIYEFDETISLSIGTTAIPDPVNANKASTNTEYIITVTNAGESKTTAAFSTTAVTDDENDITNAVGDDPGANSINLPIALAKESGKDVVLKYSVDHTFNYPSDGDFYYDSDYENNENTATKGIDLSLIHI